MTAGYDPAISSAEDASTLEELGYTQELHRGIGGYASFAAGFSFVSILTTVFAFFPLGFALGGPAFFFTWPIVFVCQFCVCLVFAELSGKFPVAGAIYQWSRRLAGNAIGWFAGWFMLIGYIVSIAALAIAMQTVLPPIWSGFQLVGQDMDPLSVDGATNGIILGAVTIVLCTIISAAGVRFMARITVTDSQTEAAVILVRFLIAVPVGALLGWWLLRRVGPGLVAGGGMALAAIGLFMMSRWTGNVLDSLHATIVLVLVGLGVGLAIAPVNDAALADAPQHAHGTASSLVVVSRMVGMVVGLALLTGVGLHRYYEAVDALPREQQTDAQALLDAALLQVHTVFIGAAGSAALGALLALVCLGVRRREGSGSIARSWGVEE